MGGKKPPAATPPVTSSSLEVAQAGRQHKIDLQRRQGFASTLYAGNPEQSPLNTKLGGGR